MNHPVIQVLNVVNLVYLINASQIFILGIFISIKACTHLEGYGDKFFLCLQTTLSLSNPVTKGS
jgi:hypothetical protein